MLRFFVRGNSSIFVLMRSLIPAILCFNKGNLSYIPDMNVVGADANQVNAFFKQVLQ